MGFYPPKHVAIIGAGLSGLSLALVLHRVNIPSTIYEVRSADFVQEGVIMLSPDALRVPDRLGVYERIRDKGYHFNTLKFKNDQNTTTDIYNFGHEELYGYKALRVYRHILIDELKAILSECGIEVKHDTKFSHIISDSPKAVDFAFADSTISSTSILIGADGIHSTVPYGFPPPIGKIAPSQEQSQHNLATLVIAPQDIDGSEVLIGTQGAFPEHDRKGWDTLHTGTDEVVKPFQKDIHAWPDVQWASEGERVVILGDAAHAVPPITGQGVKQAFEDVYILALLLAKLDEKITLTKSLEYWQSFRQERVDRILDLTRNMNNKRLPLVAEAKLPEGAVWKGRAEDTEQMTWPYAPDSEKLVHEWL